MARIVPTKGEFKALLNNGTTTTGAVKTLTVKYAELNPQKAANLTESEMGLLAAISTAASATFSKSIFENAIVLTSGVYAS